MPNIRILYNNVADVAATLTASTTSGSLAASNMQNEKKSSVHRSTGTTVDYTITWSTNQTVSMVCLPCTNLSTTAQVRVRVYNGTIDTNNLTTNLIQDTTKTPIVYRPSLLRWTTLNANTFAYGGFTKMVFWLPAKLTTVRGILITITDTNNPAGYIDCSRLIIGDYWSPTYNIQNGFQHSIEDLTTTKRTQSGDLLADTKPQFEKLEFSYSLLPEADKTALVDIFKNYGTYKNILVTPFPTETIETQYLIYGKQANLGITQRRYGLYDSNLILESW